MASGQRARAQPDDPNRFFLFNSQGVSFESAKADHLYCFEQIRDIVTFEDLIYRDYESFQMVATGLLPVLLQSFISDRARRNVHNAALRHCMALFGYRRYRVTEAEWRAVIESGTLVRMGGDSEDSAALDRLARFASGPIPPGPELDP